MSQASIPSRLRASWRNLAGPQRRAALAALLMLASMLLPWYSRNATAVVDKRPETDHDATMALLTFTFVEAAIFLVAIGVMLLLFARGERRAFHLPGGDGLIVTAAGAWATFLVFYRFVDQPSCDSGVACDYTLSWGIFFGLLAALFVAYSGNALRAAHVVEPPLPGDVAATTGPPPDVPERQERVTDRRRRPSADRAPTVVAPRSNDQLSFEDGDDDAPTRRASRLPWGEPPKFEDPPQKDS